VTDRDELAAWLRLLETPGLGRVSARKLLGAFGTPEGALAAPTRRRAEVVDARTAALLDSAPPDFDALVARTQAWLDECGGRDIVTLGDAAYPPLLLETADPPLLLYVHGRTELLRAEGLAVVGSRNPTPQGRDNARAFARHFSQAGLTVVSGLALGVDAAAHEGALEGAGSTVAVVGTGLDRVYPRKHRDLAHRIADVGLLVSEYPLGMPPIDTNFPIRNRLIAGLTRGTLVVEAALKSGSLITARLALEAGRDVFAIPGSIHAPQSRGVHALIKQGAKLVEGAEDVLEELRGSTPPRPSPGAGTAESEAAGGAKAGREDPLLAALGYDPVGLDTLIERTGMGPAELGARLLDLELEGRVARLPGQRFQRIARA
jgi:DNA processing protein